MYIRMPFTYTQLLSLSCTAAETSHDRPLGPALSMDGTTTISTTRQLAAELRRYLDAHPREIFVSDEAVEEFLFRDSADPEACHFENIEAMSDDTLSELLALVLSEFAFRKRGLNADAMQDALYRAGEVVAHEVRASVGDAPAPSAIDEERFLDELARWMAQRPKRVPVFDDIDPTDADNDNEES